MHNFLCSKKCAILHARYYFPRSKMVKIEVQLKNIDEKVAEELLALIIRKIEGGGLKSSIVSAEVKIINT